MRLQTEIALAAPHRSFVGLVAPLLGAVAGCSVYLNRIAAGTTSSFGKANLARVVLSAIIGAGLFWLSERLISAGVNRWVLPSEAMPRFRRLHSFTYSVFGLFLLGALGLRVDNRACVLGVFVVFLLVNVVVLPLALDAPTQAKLFSSLGWLATLFFISGIAALIYQVTWERVLFGAFGVNIESVTLVVVIFMFGLGLGSLVGGALSKRYPTRLPLLFLLCEGLTGLFGIISLPLIRFVAARTIHHGTLGIALSIFGLLSVPTLLDGSDASDPGHSPARALSACGEIGWPALFREHVGLGRRMLPRRRRPLRARWSAAERPVRGSVQFRSRVPGLETHARCGEQTAARF